METPQVLVTSAKVIEALVAEYNIDRELLQADLDGLSPDDPLEIREVNTPHIKILHLIPTTQPSTRDEDRPKGITLIINEKPVPRAPIPYQSLTTYMGNLTEEEEWELAVMIVTNQLNPRFYELARIKAHPITRGEITQRRQAASDVNKIGTYIDLDTPVTWAHLRERINTLYTMLNERAQVTPWGDLKDDDTVVCTIKPLEIQIPEPILHIERIPNPGENPYGLKLLPHFVGDINPEEIHAVEYRLESIQETTGATSQNQT